MPPPPIHYSFKLGEICGYLIGVQLGHTVIGADIPEVAPFGVVGRWGWGLGQVLRGVEGDGFGVVSGALLELWDCSHLEVVLWADIGGGSAGIVLGCAFCKIFLHHIQEIITLDMICPWIFNNNTSISMQSIRNILALFFGSVGCRIS